MGNYQLDLPPVLDADNRPMTVEEAEQSLKEPERVAFDLSRGGVLKKYVVLCDLNNVDGAAMDEFDVFKNRQYAIFHESNRSKSFRAGKKVEDTDEEDNQVSGEQAIKMAKMKPEQRKIFLGLLYPPDWETYPVVLASNLPDMPRDGAECKRWFERGGPIAQEVMEAIVMVIDPTGPLAQDRKRMREAEKMEQEMMAAMNHQLENLKNMSLNSSNAPSSTQSATGSEQSESNSTLAADEQLSEEQALELAIKLEQERLNTQMPSSIQSENGGSPSDAAGATESAVVGSS